MQIFSSLIIYKILQDNKRAFDYKNEKLYIKGLVLIKQYSKGSYELKKLIKE